MSDQNTGLPIRTQADGADERIHSKIVDFTAPGGVDKQMEVSEKLAHIRAFGQGPAGVKVQLKLSELGNANADGVYNVTNNTLPSTSGPVVHTRNATPGPAQQVIRQTGISNSTVHAADVALCDGAGTPVSVAAPLPVTLVASGAGTEVNDYDTQAALAAAATDDHIYTAVGVFLLRQVWAAASGKIKIEIAVDPDGLSGYTTVAVGFNSTANPNINPTFAPVELAAGGLVKVTRTNKDNQAQDVYSTIIGVEV